MDRAGYHLEELRVAQDPSHRQHILPPIGREHRRVLDVGCGAGQILIACNPAADVVAVGIDPSPEALSLGRSLDARLRLVCGLGEKLPFAGASFDFVFSRVALPYMHIDGALAEMARVLEPGGALWLTLHPWTRVLGDAVREARQLHGRAVVHAVYVLANGVALNTFGREFAWPFGRGGYESFQTERGIRRALQRAGFEHVRIRRDAFFVATASRRR
jgi:ubiquinone/menaquinone biosynthesis C-methylase UbiE